MRTKLKIAIIEAGLKHQHLASKVNEFLPANERISEMDVTRFVTSRKAPSATQATALSAILGKPVESLFPAEEEPKRKSRDRVYLFC